MKEICHEDTSTHSPHLRAFDERKDLSGTGRYSKHSPHTGAFDDKDLDIKEDQFVRYLKTDIPS